MTKQETTLNSTWENAPSSKVNFTAQKMKFSIKDFFSKCDQIRQLKITLSQNIYLSSILFQCSALNLY